VILPHRHSNDASDLEEEELDEQEDKNREDDEDTITAKTLRT